MKEKRILDTREKILQSVIKMLTEGTSNFSMAQIARVTGVSKSSLYHFFSGKKDLFQAVIVFIFEQLIHDIEKVYTSQDFSPVKKLTSMVEVFIEYAESEHLVSHFIFQQIFENDTEMLKKIFSMREYMKSFFTEVLAEGVTQNAFHTHNTAKSAEIIMGFLESIALRATFSCPEISHQFSSQELCSHLLNLVIEPS